MKFTVTGNSTTAMAKVNAISLFDGSTSYGSMSLTTVTPTTATATFSNLTIPVAQDAYKALTVKADFAAGVTNSDSVYVSIATPSSDVTYQQPNLSSTNPSSSAVTGNAMYLFNGKAASLTFTGATSAFVPAATTSVSAATTGSITFDVTANGGTLTALTSSTIKAKWNSTILPSSYMTVSFTPIGGTKGSDLSDGQTAHVTVSFNVPKSVTGTAAFVNFNIYEIDWSVGGTSASQTWGFTGFTTADTPVQQ